MTNKSSSFLVRIWIKNQSIKPEKKLFEEMEFIVAQRIFLLTHLACAQLHEKKKSQWWRWWKIALATALFDLFNVNTHFVQFFQSQDFYIEIKLIVFNLFLQLEMYEVNCNLCKPQNRYDVLQLNLKWEKSFASQIKAWW